MEFLKPIKCTRNTRTTALLRADSDGYSLLRLQRPEPDARGIVAPETPVLVHLDAEGALLQQLELPGFGAADSSALEWKWGIPSGQTLLAVYEKRVFKPGRHLFARRFDIAKNTWNGDEIALFPGNDQRLYTPGYRVSPNGNFRCIYAYTAGKEGINGIWAALFDADCQLLWSKHVPWVNKDATPAPRQVFCSDYGDVAVHAHAFIQGAREARVASPSYWPDGLAALPGGWDVGASGGAAFSHIICLFNGENTPPAWYYPAAGKSYSSDVVLGQGPDDQLYCTGFTGSEAGKAERYFVYTIHLKSREGAMLQQGPLPLSLRKIFLSEKDVADKKTPVEGLNPLEIAWTADKVAWLLAEQTVKVGDYRMSKDAALMRLDSAGKINGARLIERSSRHVSDAPQYFGAMVSIRSPKGGWYFCFNNGNWPKTRTLLAECKRGGQPVVSELADCHVEGVTLLPHTALAGDDNWYFVAESEYREMFRMVELRPASLAKRK